MERILVIAALATAFAAGLRLTPRSGLARRAYLAAGHAFVILSWTGIALAEAGVFAPVAWIGTAGVFLVASFLVSRSAADAASTRSRRRTGWAGFVVAAALAAVIASLHTPVMDARLVGQDPGVYALTAARLDHTGGLAYRDALLPDLGPDVRQHYFPEAGEAQLSTSRSMGFYVADATTGRIVPQFLPMAPVWLAVGRWIAGPASASVAGLAALWLASLGAVFVVGRIAGPVGGVVAGFLLAMNFAAGWFARGAAAEPFALALMLVAAAAILDSEDTGDVRSGALAGAALGLVWLTKLEMLLLAVPLAGLFIVDLFGGRFRRSATWSFWIAIVLTAGHFFVHAWVWSRPYVHDVLLVPGTSLTTVSLAAAAALAIALAAVFVSRRLGYPHWRTGLTIAHGAMPAVAVRLGVGALVVAGLAYGYWIRPTQGGWDADNVPQLAWMISTPGLLLATAGLLLLLLRREIPPGAGRVVAILLPVSAILIYSKMIIPHLLWAYRRFLPTILPLAIIAIGVAVGSGARLVVRLAKPGARARGFAGAALAVMLLLASVVTFGHAWEEARFYGAIVDLEGTGALVEELGRAIPPDALVLFEPRTRRGLLRLEGAVQHELRRDVLRLRDPDLRAATTWQVLLTQRRRDRSVFLMTSGYLRPDPDLGVEPLREFVFETTRLEDSSAALPRQRERLEIRARLYRLLPETRLAPLSGQLDLGAGDDFYLDGPTFHGIEIQESRRYRWTTGLGRSFLPGLDESAERLVLRMASSYPPASGRQTAAVSLNGHFLGTLELRRGWRDYALELPLEARTPSERLPVLEIRVEPTFRPQELLGSDDPRLVGVAVDLIRWGASPR